jgi:hypothetical protein
MGLWIRSSVVVYRVYHGLAEMEGGMARHISTRGGSRTQELDAAGQREITAGLCSRAAKGGGGV